MGRFVALAAAYESRVGQGREHIVLKRDHSLRVHALVSRIVAREDLSQPWIYRAAALLHDIGRFSQFERFGTFRDDRSVDHGSEGAQVLRTGNYLDALKPGERQRIVQTVELHNKRELPGSLDPLTRSMCEVVRDGDKLDIVPVVLSKMRPGGPRDPVVTLGLVDDAGAWTASVLKIVERGANPAYADLGYLNDFKLLLASWGPKLSLRASRQIFAARGHLEQIFATLPQTERFACLKADLSHRLAV